MKKSPTPEKLILTQLFLAQKRLRFVRGCRAGLRWFGVGAALAALGLVVLWNWDTLPGPWQWLATAGRPAELLWLPPLFSLGGFASQWLSPPAARGTAYQLDTVFDTQEKLLTATDWILSEKPRTILSERLLSSSAALLSDEGRFRNKLKELEPVSLKQGKWLLSLLVPILLLVALPEHVGLPDSAAVVIGKDKIDILAQELQKELDEARSLEDPEKKLKSLLEQLKKKPQSEVEKLAQDRNRRELQQTLDGLKRLAKAQKSARELLETLSQRARQGETLSEEDKAALKALKRMARGQKQKDALDKVESDWQAGDNREAAESLEEMQREAGEAAKGSQQSAKGGQEALESQESGGQEFNEGQGDEYDKDGKKNGQGDGQGQGQGQGQGEGQGQGQGEGDGPGDFGEGTTQEDQGAQGGASGRQSDRQSERTKEWVEEFENLHPPERTEYEKSQTKVKGQNGEDGPRYRTNKEGRGEATEPSDLTGSGGILEYQESAENALLRDEVPADYREKVRDYFEALNR